MNEDGLILYERSLRGVPYYTSFTRAGSECICEVCWREYWRHEEVIVWGTDRLILTALCDGRYVKL